MNLNLKNVNKFNFKCVKVLPLTYEVLCKVVNKLNEIIEIINDENSEE